MLNFPKLYKFQSIWLFCLPLISISYETDQWPVEHQQVVWQCVKCDQQPADITQVANIKMNNHKPVEHRQVVMKILRSTENRPVTCQHQPGHHTDQWPVWCWQVWFEKYFFNWLEPKITTNPPSLALPNKGNARTDLWFICTFCFPRNLNMGPLTANMSHWIANDILQMCNIANNYI